MQTDGSAQVWLQPFQQLIMKMLLATESKGADSIIYSTDTFHVFLFYLSLALRVNVRLGRGSTSGTRSLLSKKKNKKNKGPQSPSMEVVRAIG